MRDIRFTPDQRAELLSLGVPAETIERLEHRVLPLARRYLTQDQPRNVILNEFRNVERAMSSARNAIEGLLNEVDQSASRVAARWYLAGGGRRYRQDGLRLDETSKSLATAIDIMKAAIDRVPPGPLRHKLADPYPVELIHKALLEAQDMDQGPSAMRFKPSASPPSKTRPFRRIVGICYDAIDLKSLTGQTLATDSITNESCDPERAIKAYLPQWREHERYAREMLPKVLARRTERPSES